MLNGIHFLLTYACTNECDHCFLHCSPRADGTFTLEQLSAVFDEIGRLGSVKQVYFEGGEPFLYYPLLLAGVQMAVRLGLQAGIVTNAYWATSVEDARMWLKPLRRRGVAEVSISDDDFHLTAAPDSPPKFALAAARSLRIPCDTISIAPSANGENVRGGSLRFKGRAAERVADGLPRRPCQELTCCPYEDLKTPQRVHLDCFGNVQVCQGLSIGNMCTTPLASLTSKYRARKHPICGPLAAGGPRLLAQEYGLELADDFVDECHYCYAVRKTLVTRFPEYLAPGQAYGLT
jgi:hypothetical protein